MAIHYARLLASMTLLVALLISAAPALAGCDLINAGDPTKDLSKGSGGFELDLGKAGNNDVHERYKATKGCVLVAASDKNFGGHLQSFVGDDQEREFGSKLSDKVSSFACFCQ